METKTEKRTIDQLITDIKKSMDELSEIQKTDEAEERHLGAIFTGMAQREDGKMQQRVMITSNGSFELEMMLRRAFAESPILKKAAQEALQENPMADLLHFLSKMASDVKKGKSSN